MDKLEKVAVYGTLRSGCHNNYLLRNQKFLGNFEVHSPLALYTSGCLPFVLVRKNETHRLVYDVYEVDQPAMASLDMLEGHPDWYKRVLVPTPKGKAWLYIMPTFSDDRNYTYIRSGDWSKSQLGGG